MTQWQQFITYRPPVYLIDENLNVHLIRRGEDLQYIQELEHVPDHLKI